MFKEKIESVKGIATLYPETIQIVTTKKSGIQSVEDLKGKVVSVGEAGSGTRANAEQILEVHGMTLDDIKARTCRLMIPSPASKTARLTPPLLQRERRQERWKACQQRKKL